MNSVDLCVMCPHCNNHILIYVKDINCAIFRHGILKCNRQQIEPHAIKRICDDLAKNDKIYGCGKPFKITKENDKYIAEICEYI